MSEAEKFMESLLSLKFNRVEITSLKKEAVNLLDEVISHAKDKGVPAYMKCLARNYDKKEDTNYPYGLLNTIADASILYKKLEENRGKFVLAIKPCGCETIQWGEITKDQEVLVVARDHVWINTEDVHYIPNDDYNQPDIFSREMVGNMSYEFKSEYKFGKNLNVTIKK